MAFLWGLRDKIYLCNANDKLKAYDDERILEILHGGVCGAGMGIGIRLAGWR